MEPGTPIDQAGDFVTIETPEHVVLHFELAGVMSRVVAATIDLGLQLAIFLVLGIAALVATGSGWIAGDFSQEMSKVTCAVLALLLFVDIWGYSIVFEIFMRGQTPGKRLMRLRVIRDGGYALTPGDVIVRNLMRVADFVPFGYTLGMAVMCMNRLNKRIGDFVAGTLVIRDLPSAPPPPPLRTTELRRRSTDPSAVDQLRAAGVHRLTADQVKLIEGFLERRHGLEAQSRRELARRVAQQISQALGVASWQPELFLQDVLLAYRESQKTK